MRARKLFILAILLIPIYLYPLPPKGGIQIKYISGIGIWTDVYFNEKFFLNLSAGTLLLTLDLSAGLGIIASADFDVLLRLHTLKVASFFNWGGGSEPAYFGFIEPALRWKPTERLWFEVGMLFRSETKFQQRDPFSPGVKTTEWIIYPNLGLIINLF
jgi:hypothetical protein